MARVSAALVVVCLTIFLLGSDAKVVKVRDVERMSWDNYLQYLCTNNFIVYPSYVCDPYTSTTAGSTTPSTTAATTLSTTSSSSSSTTTEEDDDNDDSHEGPIKVSPTSSTTTTSSTSQSSSTGSSSSSSTTTISGSPLEHAHWCQLPNGSYVSLFQSFIYNACLSCVCTQNHKSVCGNLQCMSTYCIDGSKPVTQVGQCCPQCSYENSSSTCVVDGLIYATGSLIRRTTDNIQCWCQSGTVECRKSSSSLTLSNLDYWGEGTAVYVIVIVICVVLILGTLLCCGGGLFFYYYYHNNQQTFQDAYAQYYSNAGWQPMADDGQVIVDGVAQEKQAEAEQQYAQEQYPTGQTEEYIPPPYALYNGSYPHQQTGKEQPFA